MKKFYRALCLCILLCMAVAIFAACDNSEEAGNTSDVSQGTSQPGESEGSGETSEVTFPLEKQDFGGVTIKALSYETEGSFQYQTFEIAPQSINTDPVNDIAYNRAQLIRQEYGIDLVQELVATKNDVVDTVREMVTTDMDNYQLVVAPLHYLAKLVADDAYYDLSAIENGYIDLSKPYWDQKINKQLSVMGHNFFVNGDAIVSDDEATWAVFFNKDIAADHNLADAYGAASIYEIVERGDWTIDVMYEMAKKVVNDNGDGMSWSASSDDVWGISAQAYDGYTFTVAGGHTMTKLDEDGVPYITIGDEGNIEAYDRVHNILNDKTVCSLAEVEGRSSSNRYEEIVQIFANGGALFTPEKIGTVSNPVMRNANIRYGLLPMPKIDETQEDYTSTITVWWCSAMAIPTSNVEKLDATCYAMEALAYYGMEMLTPEYYDRTLKNKRFEDQESEDMLDLIFRNRTYDVGIVLNFANDMLGFYDTILISGNNTHVSALDSKRDAYQEAIDDFADMFLE